MENPLLAEVFEAPDGALPFEKLKSEHFLPALKASIEKSRVRVAAVRDAAEAPTFENTLIGLEQATESLDVVAETFFNLLNAEADDTFHALAKEFSPLVAAFSNDVLLDAGLFSRIQKIWDQRQKLKFSTEQERVLEKNYRSFVRNGALLNDEDKKQLRDIDAELARLTPQFSENVLKATYAFELEIQDEAQLEGLPESVRQAAASAAEKKGKKKTWLFTLEAPSYIPFMTYSAQRELREKMYRAYASRSFGGAHDNQENVKRIVHLRQQRARLLGYESHAHYVLEERMAEKPEKVRAFLDRLLEVCLPAAEKEFEEVRAFARASQGPLDFQPWDFTYYSEKLKEKKFHFSEEELRPYFRLENVVKGVFQHAERLFGLSFSERNDVPVYHPDVKVYEVKDTQRGFYVGLFYTDFFPRPTKKGGAWMTAFREQGTWAGTLKRPHVSIVCNFTKPLQDRPSLLSLDEVRTLYHEFGHALHGLLSECEYRSVAGTNVFWDFVELPSQLMENWVLEKEVLDSFAVHYETGEPISAELCRKIKDSSQYLAGYRALRQLSFGYLDMSWHETDLSHIGNVADFEDAALAKTRVLPKVPGTNVSCSFSHIFAGGYSAGYYSYKWAEVLEADAFEAFQEAGLYDAELSKKLRREIFSRGGSEPPMVLFRRFRGRDPDPQALLRREGLLS